MTGQEFSNVISLIHSADANQLAEFREAIKSRGEQLGRQVIVSLRPGQRVKWDGKRGPQTGIVERVKNVWVEVQADKTPGQLIGTRWNVRASALIPL